LFLWLVEDDDIVLVVISLRRIHWILFHIFVQWKPSHTLGILLVESPSQLEASRCFQHISSFYCLLAASKSFSATSEQNLRYSPSHALSLDRGISLVTLLCCLGSLGGFYKLCEVWRGLQYCFWLCHPC